MTTAPVIFVATKSCCGSSECITSKSSKSCKEMVIIEQVISEVIHIPANDDVLRKPSDWRIKESNQVLCNRRNLCYSRIADRLYGGNDHLIPLCVKRYVQVQEELRYPKGIYRGWHTCEYIISNYSANSNTFGM